MASTTPNQLLLSKWGMQVPALIALLLCFISAGCTPVALVNRPSPPIAMQVATFPEAKAMLSSTQLRPTPLTGNDSYQLTVDLDYPRRLLQVRAQIAYVNRTGVPLSELALVVEPNRSSGVFTLHNLSWGDGSAISNYSLRGPRLDIPLPTALKPVEKIELQVSYSLALPARPGYLGYSRRQMNVGDWVPFVPPYRPGTGWLIHDLAAVGEHTVYPVADYDILIKTTEGDNLVIAASAPGEKVADGIRFHLAEARNFAWSASPEYESSTIEVDGVTVAAYWFPEHAVAGQAALVATAQALRLYNDQFGPYPHPMLTNVEAEFADGMEYDGLYFLGKEYYAAYAGNPAGYLTMLAAHETAHQWWYGVIGNDQALEPYLDEAFATYSELLFYEAL